MERILRFLSGQPWHLAVLGLVILTITNGMTATGITIFDPILLETFGWLVSQLKLGGTITFLGAASLIFFVGALIDRIGVKPCLLFGTAMLSLCIFGYSLIQSLLHLYGIHLAFALVLATAGTNTVVIMVSRLIPKYKGMAIGLVLTGTSIGGAVMSRVGAELLDRMSWREAFRFEALIPLGAFLLILLLVPNLKPQEKTQKEQPYEGMLLQDVLRTRTFWALTLSAAMTYFCIMSIVQHMVLHATALELDRDSVANLFLYLTVGAIITKFSIGALVDRVDAFWVYRILHIVMVTGLLLFVSMNSGYLPAAVLITALGWGGMYTLYNFMVIDLFGLKSAGKVTGLVSVFESIGAASGPLVLAAIFDWTGGYRPGFVMLTVMLCLSLALSFLLRQRSELAAA